VKAREKIDRYSKSLLQVKKTKKSLPLARNETGPKKQKNKGNTKNGEPTLPYERVRVLLYHTRKIRAHRTGYGG